MHKKTMASANTFVKCIAEVSKSTFTAPSLSDAEDVVEKTEAEAEVEVRSKFK